MSKTKLALPIVVAIGAGGASIAGLTFILLGSSSSSDPANDSTATEHESTSLIGGLEDDIIFLGAGESKTFNYSLDRAKGDAALMTGFVQLTQGNGTGISSVTVKIGDASNPSYHHQLQISAGQLKQIDFIIPVSGSVTFQNNGERLEKILLNLQLTYTAVSDR